MIQDVKQFIEPYVTFDKPIPYKGLLIYPIRMKDIYEFLFSYDVLTIEKNKIPDVEVIQMSYLNFIMTKLITDNTEFNKDFTVGNIWVYKFSEIMRLCFQIEPHELMVIEDEGKISLKIKDVVVNAQDFEDIKRIIMYQNIVEYDDTTMNEDFKKVVEDYYKIKNKGIVSPTIECKINTLISNTNYTAIEINELTYRKFDQCFKIIVDKIDYIVNAMAKIQGSNAPLEHWVYKSDKQKYSEIFSEANNFESNLIK